MNEIKSELNKPLIIFTILILAILGSIEALTEPVYFSADIALFGGLVMLVFTPILVLWLKALWNNIIPRITNWRAIDFWEALGISTFIFFMIG